MDLSKLSDNELFAAAAMPSLIHQESGGRAGVVGPQTAYGRAVGKTQMLPATAEATAKRIGVAWRPELMTDDSPEADEYQTRLGQAYLQEGLEATGNLPDALRYYHGGPDRKLWGPKTEAYAKSVLAHAGYNDAGSSIKTPDLASMSDEELMALAGEPGGQAEPAKNVQPATNLGANTPEKLPSADASKGNQQGVTNTETGAASYNPTQASAFRAMQAAGLLDLTAPVGSKKHPFGMIEGGEPKPGAFYVDLDGSLKQAPDGNRAVAEDVAKSLPSGLADTLAAANPMNAFGPGAILDVLGQAGDKAGIIQSLLSGKRPSIRELVAMPSFPGARAAALESAPLDHTPQTWQGQAAKTAGAMLPNIVAPGSAAQRVAGVVLPTLGAEGAGALTKLLGGSRDAQSVARGVGGLVGGVASTTRLGGAAKLPKAMSLDELKAASAKAWQQVDESGFRFEPKAVKAMATDIAHTVAAEGGAALYPQAEAVATRINQLAKTGDLTIAQLNRLKSQVGEKLMQPGSTEAHVGAAIRDKIEGLIGSSNDPTLKAARDIYTRLKKTEEVAQRMDSADLGAASTYSGGNVVNATRQKLRPLIDPKSPQRMRNLTPDEAKAMNAVVRGTPAQNLMRYSSKVLSNRFLQGAAMVPTLGIGSVGMEVGGTLLRKLGEASTMKSLDELMALIARGGQKPPPLPRIDPASLAARLTYMEPGIKASASQDRARR